MEHEAVELNMSNFEADLNLPARLRALRGQRGHSAGALSDSSPRSQSTEVLHCSSFRTLTKHLLVTGVQMNVQTSHRGMQLQVL